jgi:DNA-binding SARP family transcriptional activator/Flp pilus assembly protein TadD
MPHSTLRLLGEFALETRSSAGPLRLGRKGRALLACAAMQGSVGASRGRLIALLWPDHNDEDARAALRQCLHLVRRSMGAAAEGLETEGDRIVLRDVVFEVDVHRFEVLAARADMESMVAAAELYCGDLLDGLDAGEEFAQWLRTERERLRDMAHGLVARLGECASGAPAIEATVRLAHRLLAGDPVHEGCYRALMRLHARAGLRSKALQTWNECRRILRRELDVEPSRQTAAVIEQLRDEPENVSTLAERFTTPPPVITGTNHTTFLRGRHAEDPMVLDLLLRGWQHLTLYTAEDNAKARAAFEAAIARAGDDAEMVALLGWTHWFDSISGWTADAALSYRLAANCASRAMACNRGHPSPYNLQGKVLLWRMEHEAALEQLRRAVTISPSSAYAHFNLGDASMWCGRCEEALAHLDRAMRLDPNDHGFFLTIRGMALWMTGELRESQAAFDSAITRNPSYAWAHGGLAVVHFERGDLDAARQAAATTRRLNRRFSLSFAREVLPFRVAAHRQRAVDAWGAAGMPEEEAPGGRQVLPPDLMAATGGAQGEPGAGEPERRLRRAAGSLPRRAAAAPVIVRRS